MLIFLTTLLATLWSIFRSRASLGLENLALRHQIGVLQRSAGKRPKIDLGRPPAVDLSVAPLARLALGVGHRQARNGRPDPSIARTCSSPVAGEASVRAHG